MNPKASIKLLRLHSTTKWIVPLCPVSTPAPPPPFPSGPSANDAVVAGASIDTHMVDPETDIRQMAYLAPLRGPPYVLEPQTYIFQYF